MGSILLVVSAAIVLSGCFSSAPKGVSPYVDGSRRVAKTIDLGLIDLGDQGSAQLKLKNTAATSVSLTQLGDIQPFQITNLPSSIPAESEIIVEISLNTQLVGLHSASLQLQAGTKSISLPVHGFVNSDSLQVQSIFQSKLWQGAEVSIYGTGLDGAELALDGEIITPHYFSAGLVLPSFNSTGQSLNEVRFIAPAKALGSYDLELITAEGSEILRVEYPAHLRFDHVVAGYDASMLIGTDRNLYALGSNIFGELGIGNNDNQARPVRVALPGAVADAATNLSHSCAVLENNDVYCWGRNRNGQLGDGTTTSSLTPVYITGGVTAVATAWTHTCAITTSKTVQCWGWNRYANLGDSLVTVLQSPDPVMVSGLSDVNKLSASRYTSCAVTGSNDAYCWGHNDQYELGFSGASTSGDPVRIDALAGQVADISVGDDFVCALSTDGRVLCWGSGRNGQLGTNVIAHTNAAQINPRAPVIANDPIIDAVSISAGARHACAARANGTVWCWGSNHNRQLGVRYSANENRAVQVIGVAGDIVSVTAGQRHNYARLSDGTVFAWGGNHHGELGRGHFISSLVRLGEGNRLTLAEPIFQ